MSAETTPAIERAARALLDVDHGECADLYAPRYSSARAIVAAGLDVEEMARAMHEDSCCTDFAGCDLTYDRITVTAIRAAILGEG